MFKLCSHAEAAPADATVRVYERGYHVSGLTSNNQSVFTLVEASSGANYVEVFHAMSHGLDGEPASLTAGEMFDMEELNGWHIGGITVSEGEGGGSLFMFAANESTFWEIGKQLLLLENTLYNKNISYLFFHFFTKKNIKNNKKKSNSFASWTW